MARVQSGLIGGFRGKVGAVVGYSRNGKKIVQSLSRLKGDSVNNVLSSNAIDMVALASSVDIFKRGILAILTAIGASEYYSWNDIVLGFYDTNDVIGSGEIGAWTFNSDSKIDLSEGYYLQPKPFIWIGIRTDSNQNAKTFNPNLSRFFMNYRSSSDLTFGLPLAYPTNFKDYTGSSIAPPVGTYMVYCNYNRDSVTGEIGKMYFTARNSL